MGDHLRVWRSSGLIIGAGFSNSDSERHIPVSIGSIVDDVKAGEHIWFDDGKIGGIIESVEADSFLLKITRAKPGGVKLRSEKGIV